MFDFLKLKKSLDGVTAAIKELQKTVEKKRAEYERLASLPAPREEVLEALCAYVDVEAQDKKALSQAVAEMPWAEETAPPRAERERQLEKLDREIATLEKQEKELLEQAAGLGIQV
jgi:predicted  nucleic acid-binding Zn-ribbon protein